ncbi:MAG: S46 family peptidase [Acidobacteriota bacterium]
MTFGRRVSGGFGVFCAALIAAVSGATALRADEGMWLYERPPLDLLKERYGFVPDAAFLDRLRMASVNIHASASFVSPEGLILTNHHVALGSVQRLSSPENNYVRDGFYAPTRDKEIPIPGLTIRVLVSIEDVTSRIEAACAGASSPADALKKRNAAAAAMELECRRTTGLEGEVVALFGGARHHLYRYKEYTDVRLVFAPELQAAFFGGDHDNFTYPRFDLDLAFLRAYEGGRPARIEHYLPVNPDGCREGDLVFVSGHPGDTDRLVTVAGLNYFKNVTHPKKIEALLRRQALLNAYSARSPEAARRARTNLYFFANSLKSTEGELRGLRDEILMGKKKSAESDLQAAVMGDPSLRARFGSAWSDLERAYAWAAENEAETRLKGDMPGGGWGRLTSHALTLVRYAEEIRKPDAERISGYHDSDLPGVLRRLSSPSPTYTDLEEVFLADDLERLLETFGADDPYVKTLLEGKTPREAAREALSGTRLGDTAFRRELLKDAGRGIAACEDPLLRLARRADPFIRDVERRYDEHVAAVEEEAYARIAQAGFAVYGDKSYSDATGTLRLAFGTVSGYPFASTLVPPFTTFYGLYDRAYSFGDRDDFALTNRQRERRASVRLETPLNFVCTADITGGNSGSPVVAKDGSLVGLVFDGNDASHPNAFVYDERQARCVAVDIRGILEALDKYYDAGALVREMLDASRRP